MLLRREQLLSFTEYPGGFPAGNGFWFLPGLGVQPGQRLLVQASAVYFRASFESLMEVLRTLPDRKRYRLHRS